MGVESTKGLFINLLFDKASGRRQQGFDPEAQSQGPQASGPGMAPAPARIPRPEAGLLSSVLAPKKQQLTAEQQAQVAAIEAAKKAARESGVFKVVEACDPRLLNVTTQFAHLAPNTLQFPRAETREEEVPQGPGEQQREAAGNDAIAEEQLAQRGQECVRQESGFLSGLKAFGEKVGVNVNLPKRPSRQQVQEAEQPVSEPVPPVVIVKAAGGQYVMVNDGELLERFSQTDIGRQMPARGRLFGNEYDGRLQPMPEESARLLADYIESL